MLLTSWDRGLKSKLHHCYFWNLPRACASTVNMKPSFITRAFLPSIIVCVAVEFAFAQTSTPSAVDVRLVTDQADAVLAILAKRKANQSITEADWQRVFQSEGYIRLKKRETSMKQSFEDADFKTFVLSDQLAARSQALEETVARWKRADITRAAGLTLAYLPKRAQIKAKLYPVIKPRENTFVFEVKTDWRSSSMLTQQCRARNLKTRFQRKVAARGSRSAFGVG